MLLHSFRLCHFSDILFVNFTSPQSLLNPHKSRIYKVFSHLIPSCPTLSRFVNYLVNIQPDFLRNEYDLVLNNIVQLFLNQTFLKNQLALKDQKQKLAEMKALQLQINPHFLFNTLQTLDFKALEYTGQPTAMNQMIQALR